MLEPFPERGAAGTRDSRKCPQLIVSKIYLVAHEYDETDRQGYVFAVQQCWQKLPAGRGLKRRQALD
jgi:hypothetical protein